MLFVRWGFAWRGCIICYKLMRSERGQTLLSDELYSCTRQIAGLWRGAECWKVPSNVQHLCSADNKLRQPQLIREREVGMTEGGRVQRGSEAPSTLRKHQRADTHAGGWQCVHYVWGSCRKQVPLASLCPHQHPEKQNKTLKKKTKKR